MKMEDYLYQYFHFRTFRPGQKEVISSVLKGQNTMALLPTGTGKSLCYQLPGYVMDGQVLIVSPLLSLMQDQVEQMKMNGEKNVVAINSFLMGQERKRVLANLRKYKFIFISPEMLVQERMDSFLKGLKLSLFVIDEAHCISLWGYDFRPDYLKLGLIREKLGNPLTLALTATATKQVLHDIQTSLRIDQATEVVLSVDRPNIAMAVQHTTNIHQKWDLLYKYVSNFQDPGIIYFSSKKVAEQAAEFLQSKGISRVTAYHGGMDQESRILIQQQFLHNQLDIICATSAFGMGINKENIRFVIHFHMPQQIESYLQEIGRAGRDGKRSIAILLYSVGDELMAYQLAESEIPSSIQLDWLARQFNHLKLAKVEAQNLYEEWKEDGGFSEVQWRIVSDYLFQDLDERDNFTNKLHDLNEMMENRRLLKYSKINRMKNWIQSSTCRREQILAYFEQGEKETTPFQCCDLCGFDIYSFNKIKEKERNTIDFSWKHRLADILLKY